MYFNYKLWYNYKINSGDISWANNIQDRLQTSY